MKKANWSLILNDLMVVVYMLLVFYRWQIDKNSVLMMVWIILGSLLLIRQIVAHNSFFKKKGDFIDSVQECDATKLKKDIKLTN